MGKHKSVVESLGNITRFFELLSAGKSETGKTLQSIGEPSRSFLGSYTSSMLFDNELQVFSEAAMHAGEENATA